MVVQLKWVACKCYINEAVKIKPMRFFEHSFPQHNPQWLLHVTVILSRLSELVSLSLQVLRSLRVGLCPPLCTAFLCFPWGDFFKSSERWSSFWLYFKWASFPSIFYTVLDRTEKKKTFCFVYIRFSTRWRNEWNHQDWISNAIAMGQQGRTSQSGREIWEIQPDFNGPLT